MRIVMRLLPALSLVLLAACGADGPPVAPSTDVPPPGISISGAAKVGIVGGG
jgi:predicted small lipoprotein YifL